MHNKPWQPNLCPVSHPDNNLENGLLDGHLSPRASQNEVLSCNMRLCSPIPLGFSPRECAKRSPRLPPLSCSELKWIEMSDLWALCRQNLVFLIDGDHRLFARKWLYFLLRKFCVQVFSRSLELASNSCLEPSGSQLRRGDRPSVLFCWKACQD